MSSRPPLDIFGAALAGDSKAVAECLNEGVSVSERSATYNGSAGRNYTPLFCAVKGGSLATAELLIMRGADVGAKNDRSQSPIHTVSASGNIENLKLLLQHKANVNETDGYNYSPLYYATLLGRTQIVKLLLESQADVSLKYPWHGQKEDQPTALQMANAMLQSGTQFPVEIIEMLEEAERKKSSGCKS